MLDELQKLSLQLAEVDQRHAAESSRLLLQADYDKTLLLLAAVKANKVFIDEFELLPGGWRLTPPAPPAPPVAPQPVEPVSPEPVSPVADQAEPVASVEPDSVSAE